jgi:hypothetical protein
MTRFVTCLNIELFLLITLKVTMDSRVLFIVLDSGTRLPDPVVLKAICSDHPCVITKDLVSAQQELASSQPLAMVLVNQPFPELFQEIRAQHPGAQSVLITPMTMEEYAPLLNDEEHILLDHIVAARSNPESLVDELRITIQKTLRHDLFGLDKYLMPQTKIFKHPVVGSSSRSLLNRQIATYAERIGLGLHLTKNISSISEELLMNVIYDAPAAAQRDNLSKSLNRQMELPAEQQGQFTYGCDGKIFAIGAQDPFGLFHRDIFFRYIKKVIHRADSAKIIDTKASGAGLGLFKILYSAHALICNVSPGYKTEMIALIDVGLQIRDFSKMPRSVHYFCS